MECRHCRAVAIAAAVLTGAGFNWLWYSVFPNAGALEILAVCTAVLLGLTAAVKKILTPNKLPYRSTPGTGQTPRPNKM